MPDRKNLVPSLWITATLVLLASLMVAPIRTSGFLNGTSWPDCLRRDLAGPAGQPTTCLSAGMATAAARELNALPAENEEQDRADALDEPRVSFLTPYSFRKVFDRQLIAPLSTLSLYHLRC